MTHKIERLRDLKQGVTDCITIDPHDIKIEKGHNPRNYHLPENRAHLNALKANIKEQGVQVPLLVRWDAGTKSAILVDGECRLTAALELMAEGVEIKGIKCIQVKAGNEQERLVLALTANTGKPLSKWEIGSAFQKLVKFEWSIELIAQKLGYMPRYVSECIEMSDATEEVKHLLSLEAVTPSLALKHIREDGDNAGAVLKEKVSKARAKNPTAKKVTATRERKQSGVKFTTEQAEVILKALRAGQKSDAEKTANLCAEAIEIFDAASSK